ncbi:Dual-specificity RNA methyltransferase RlmN [Buchnera aphidicola (Eriosoma lanigerum)]|uniref:23S rRNA (adenine(2503)-C(2))-methyltransferase RlmN n=1 Tax=Buchnera aphidicola TaxID=9 RepID=UPI0034640244
MFIQSSHSIISFNKTNLLNLNYDQLQKLVVYYGEKPFRAEQIMKWIYHHFCTDFNKMSNLNKALQRKLNETSFISIPKFYKSQRSSDGTIKWLVEINSKLIETVYIPNRNRATLCISSQIGCALKCHFCATGKIGFKGNLQVSDIIGQLWYVSKLIHIENKIMYPKITNVVFMGMGEPLLNFKNVIIALEIMLHPFAFNLSKNRITVSTSGIVPAIDKLSNFIDVSLAISLHASNDALRNLLMPINKKYNITALLESVKRYLKKSTANKGRVTIEYVMLNDVNDELNHAKELVKLLHNIPNKVNLIPWNCFVGSQYTCSNLSKIEIFSKCLRKHGLISTIRKSRGADILGACGQLMGNNTI